MSLQSAWNQHHHMQPTGTVLSPVCTWSHQGNTAV